MIFRFRIILLIISLVFFTLGCLKTFPVLEDPPPGEEGLIAFGLIVSQEGLTNGIFTDLYNPVSKETKISSSIDAYKNLTLDDPGREMKGEGNYRFLWVQKLRFGDKDRNSAPYFAISRLPLNEPFLIGSTSYTYTTTHTYTTVDKYGRMQTHTYTVSHFQSIPIKYNSENKEKFSFSNPGGLRIRFIGNFIAHPPEPRIDTNRPYYGNYVLTDLTEYLQTNPHAGSKLVSKFYGEEEITEAGAEIHFLKQFIVENRSRYWEGIAIRRLLEIDSEIREKILRAKIAVPKEDLPIGPQVE